MGQNPILHGGVEAAVGILETVGSGASEIMRHLTTGVRASLPDGRVFYWVKNDSGASLTAGELLVNDAFVANHVNMTPSATAVDSENVTFTLGATAATENQYEDGYLYVNVTPGAGQQFRIRQHPAANSGASLTVNLYDKVAVALTGSSRVTLKKNLYKNPQQSNTTVAEVAVGVPLVTIANGARGWVQTWGPCPVLTAGTPAVGVPVTISTGTVGAVMILEGTAIGTLNDQPHVGFMLDTGVNGEFRSVDLRIRP
jgi:hypothetical protein